MKNFLHFAISVVLLFCFQAAFAQVTLFRSTANLGSGFGYQSTIGDIDGDGDIDVLVSSDEGNNIWINNDKGGFSKSEHNLTDNSVGIKLADLDSDGDLDLFASKSAWDKGVPNKVYLNDGKGVFTEGNQTALNFNSGGCDLGDLDGDGDLDIFFANSSANTVFINDGHANFSNSNQYLGSIKSNDAELIDIDGDNDLDAILANGEYAVEKANKIYLNDGTGVFSESQIFIGNGKSYSVNCFDADNDDDTDIIIINNGNNELWINQSITSNIK